MPQADAVMSAAWLPAAPRQDGPQVTVVEEVSDDAERDDRAADRGTPRRRRRRIATQDFRHMDGSGTSPDRCRPGWDSCYFFPFLLFLLFLATRITPLPDSDRSMIC